MRDSSMVGRLAVFCCLLLAVLFGSVTSASAKGGTDVAGAYEFKAYGRSAAEPDREEVALVGNFSLYQHIGNQLGGALGGGTCGTGEFGSLSILGTSSGSSVTFTATATPPAECSVTFMGTLAGESMSGKWSVSFGEEECGEDEPCEGEFKAQRVQKYPTEEEEIEAREAKEKKEKEEAEKRKKEEEEEDEDDEEPAVTSVTDQSTGTNSGSILGGDKLIVNGSGFKVSDDEEAEVQFFLGSNMVASSDVAPISGSEIEVEAPKLTSSTKDVPEGATGLALDVRVQITFENEDGETETVKSPSSLDGSGPDVFEALIPKVDSVVDEVTGKGSGSILGGDTLVITGSGFNVPAGGEANVAFVLGGEKLGGDIQVTPVSSSKIELTGPGLLKYESKIPTGSNGLATYVGVAITNGTEDVQSKSPGEEENTGDVFEALIPKVDSVEDTTTKTNSGTILGEDTLIVNGSGFDVPKGGEVNVAFVLGGEKLGGDIQVTPVSSSKIELTVPSLLKYESKIPTGSNGLAAYVGVAITNGTEDVQSRSPGEEENAGDIFEALIPRIDSVTDGETDTNSGTILGGDKLKIVGSGFTVPEGGEAVVSFSTAGLKSIDDAKVTPISDTEIEVETPSLLKHESEIPDGKDALATDIVVGIFNSTDEDALSSTEFDATGPDVFEALIPKVDSVTDEETDTNSGTILGGDKLKIVGSGFTVPDGGSATVEFLEGGTRGQLDEVDVTPLSETEIQLTSPDLSKYAAGLGDSDLLSDVRVKIEDDTGETISPVSADDHFSFEPLAFVSADSTDFTVGHEEEFAIGTEGGTSVELKETGELPAGVSFVDSGEGEAVLGGKPDAGTAGDYDVKLTATDASGAEVTQDFTLTVQDVPGAPQNVAATAGVNAAKVFWDAPKDDGESEIESYTVTAEPGGQTTTVDTDVTSATVEHLSAGAAYTFSVTARNDIGEGESAESPAVVPTSSQLEDPQAATSDSQDGSASTEPVTSDGTTISADADGEGTIEVGTYASDPVAELGDATSFFDVATTPQSSFTSASFKICGVGASSSIEWWNPVSGSWQPVSSQTAPSGTPLCVTVTVNTTTSPSLAELYGTVFALVAQPPSTETPPGAQTSSTPNTSTPTTLAPSTPTQPATPATGSVSLAGSTITVASSGAAAVKLRCAGKQTCSGELTLTAERKAGRAKHEHAKAQTIGTASFAIPPGKTIVVYLTLNTAGKTLLSAAHGHLGATLTIHQSSPTPSNTRTDNIDLVKLPPHTTPHAPGGKDRKKQTKNAKLTFKK